MSNCPAHKKSSPTVAAEEDIPKTDYIFISAVVQTVIKPEGPFFEKLEMKRADKSRFGGEICSKRIKQDSRRAAHGLTSLPQM